MDDVRQGHVVDASLAFLQKLEDEMRVLNEIPKTSHPQLGSSDSSSSSSSTTTMDPPNDPNVAEGKRKRMETAGSSEDGVSKKIRIASADQHSVVFGPTQPPRHDMSQQLPAEVWQHIFSLLSPRTLGGLLRVSRLFHKYLDPDSPFNISAPVFHVPSILPTLSPDAIWRASRCLLWPKMPAPLRGRSELDMWRFACSRSCQICGRLDKTNTAEDSLPWRRGPGNNAVSPIFLFFINLCGNCLVQKSVKEVDLLLSTSNPSFILPGLPMVFLTPDVNVVSPQAMRNTPVPATVQLTKVYWPAQVESLQAELEDVKRFGVATAEEWIKGLDSRGTEAIHDASRWDRWYLSGGVRQMRMRSSPAQPTSTANRGSSSNIPNVGEVAAGKNITATHSIRRNPKRHAREIMEELKSKRRADIEARAAQLRPPILPGVLGNLQSFQAALGENAPLDDKEWKLLKPLLLAQRDKAEQMQKKSAANMKASQKHQNKSKTKGARDSRDYAQQDRQDIETFVRVHISTLADQVIRDRWAEGRSVKKKTCASFATEVLAYVREQFYADTSGVNAASFTRRLTLDDMRWIFDYKVGPLTNRHRKEFLFCSGCPKSKLYGFHAAVQHYAAKHAPKKTKGLVPDWGAEWPEEPLFGSSPVQQETTVSSTLHQSQGTEDADPCKPRVDTMARILQTIWQVLKNAQNIPTSVKMSVLIRHIAKRYQEQYREPAPFDIFLAGLDHHTSFSAVSDSQGLACGVCLSSQKQDRDKKAFSLSTLAHHFHDVHDKERISPGDWYVDMVSLPDMQILQGLQADIRKNKPAFELVSDALPWLFKGEEEKSQDDPVPLRTRQSSVTAADLEVTDAASAPVMHRYSDERFLPTGDTPNLLPANAVYARPNTMHEQPRYRADIFHTQNFDERRFEGHAAPDRIRAQYIAREPVEWSNPTWESAHLSSIGVGSRHIVPEPRRHFYLHLEHEPHMTEATSAYSYHQDTELQRERSHTEVENGRTSRQSYVSSGYQQPISSTALYHYAESIPSYNRYDILDVRSLPNENYFEYPTISHEYRISSSAGYSNYPNREQHNNTAPATRVYNAYASRYPLANRRFGGLDYDIE